MQRTLGALFFVCLFVACKKNAIKDLKELRTHQCAALAYPVGADGNAIKSLDQPGAHVWADIRIKPVDTSHLAEGEQSSRTIGSYAIDDPEFSDLLNAREVRNRLQPWQVNASVLFFNLKPGDYIFEFSISGHTQPMEIKNVRLGNKLSYVSFNAASIYNVGFELTKKLDVDFLRPYSDKWKLVLRELPDGINCIWTSGYISKTEAIGIAGAFVKAPSTLEGWIIVDQTIYGEDGVGMPLAPIQLRAPADSITISFESSRPLRMGPLPAWIKIKKDSYDN